jgi:hypothetical protein
LQRRIRVQRPRVVRIKAASRRQETSRRWVVVSPISIHQSADAVKLRPQEAEGGLVQPLLLQGAAEGLVCPRQRHHPALVHHLPHAAHTIPQVVAPPFGSELSDEVPSVEMQRGLGAVVGHQQLALVDAVGHRLGHPSRPGGQLHPLAVGVVDPFSQGEVPCGGVEFHPHQLTGAVVSVAGLSPGWLCPAWRLAQQVAALVGSAR